LIIGIVAAALLVPVVLCVIGAIPIPAAIHNIFVPQTIPEALREYEEAGTLEKLYENGNLSGYQVVAYREDGELDSVQIFDTAGNCVRNELYNSDGYAFWGMSCTNTIQMETGRKMNTTIRTAFFNTIPRINTIRAKNCSGRKITIRITLFKVMCFTNMIRMAIALWRMCTIQVARIKRVCMRTTRMEKK